ncbi:IclR family transcriptional regulator [Flavobacterium qiangtangense]|uniref:IclR family transcriptional regulator n=1 Tax=Flavobacterium qiangtangense TaxID=1442595 RepID=A0ABW1PIS7_9FLAO
MIQSVKRTFDILEYIVQNGNRVRLNDIADALELQNTTVHNFLNTLKEIGYVEQDDESPRYRVTEKMRYLYSTESNIVILKRHLRPLLKEISSLTGETTYLSVQMGSYFRHELKCEPKRAVKISLQLGKEFDMLKTAVGKIFMAHSSHLKNTLCRNQGIESAARIHESLEGVLANGRSFDLEEFEKDLNCVALPIFYNNRLVAALGISGPAYRFKMQEMDEAFLIATRVINEKFNNDEQLEIATIFIPKAP